jgi:DNA-directed RNA polymerase specialized sigma24 family protein
MADDESTNASQAWLPVIGKALAYLCLQEAQRKEPDKFESVLKKVKFLQDLGLSRDEAAKTAGSSPGSVRVLQHNRKKQAKHGKAKKRKGKR